MNQQFYELVKSKNDSPVLKEVYTQVDLQKNQKIGKKVNEHTESEKITNSTEEVRLQDLNETKAREAEGELHHMEEKQKAAQEHCELESLQEAVVSEGQKKIDTEKVGEVHMSVDLDEMHQRLDADKDACQINVEKYPEDVQQPSLWEKKFKLQSSAISSQKYTNSYIRGEDDSPLWCKAKLERHDC